ncbi:MAG: oxygenase MpaB family protein [Sciscionella sp.]
MPQPEPEPLGPDSLTWKYFGDWRGVLLALWAGSMQNMHPELGAGVEEHSLFFAERWQRFYRSLYPIGGVVYDEPRARATALQVRGYHNAIGGVDACGRRYHALNPATYYWAHATFFMVTLLVADRLGPGLSDAEKRTLYEEHKQWYRLYGVSERPMPPDWDSFLRYYERMCTEVLEDNKATRDVLDIDALPKPPSVAFLPDAAWRLLRVPVARGFVWLTVGMYHPAVRERLGYSWSATDERVHRILGRAIHYGWQLLPFRLRYHPRARAGWLRAAGKLPADHPPVETPARNLPPLDERGDPKHYCPAL